MKKERMKGRKKERKKEIKEYKKNAHQINVLKVAFPFSVR